MHLIEGEAGLSGILALRRLDFEYPFARMKFIETKSDVNLSYFRLKGLPRWTVGSANHKPRTTGTMLNIHGIGQLSTHLGNYTSG